MTETRPLGLGLIGCGDFGRFCMQAYRSLADVRPVAVADVRQQAAESLGSELNVPAFSDPEKLIACGEVDIVHVATPPSSHHELVMAAVREGKHVLCEKPLALSVRQADRLLAAAEEGGVIVPVNFVLRYNQVTEAAKAVIDSGLLGAVLSARFTNCAFDTKLPRGHWFWDKAVSGGIFIEHGVHFFDLYAYWLGPGKVIGAHAEKREGTVQEDRATCTVRHDGGALASHYHGFDQIHPMDRADHRLVCEMGDIRVEGWIPLTLTVDAAVDDQAAEKLTERLPGAESQTLETYGAGGAHIMGRGTMRHVTRRIRLRYLPQPDKLSVYADSARALLADQVAAIRNRKHRRRITESNGRDCLVLAEAAASLASKAPQ